MSIHRKGNVSDTPMPDAHDDFHHQHLELTGRVFDPQTNLGADGQTPDMLHPQHGIEPAGGLDRNEMAELRYLIIHEAVGPVPDQPHGSQANVRGAMALSLSDEIEGFPQGYQNGNVANSYEEESVEGESYFISRGRESLDSDLLWFRDSNYTNGILDTASGTGQGSFNAGSAAYPYVIDYRELYGQGPIVSGRDEIQFGYAYNLTEYNSDGNLVQWVNCSFVWDVFETDQEIRRG